MVIVIVVVVVFAAVVLIIFSEVSLFHIGLREKFVMKPGLCGKERGLGNDV